MLSSVPPSRGAALRTLTQGSWKPPFLGHQAGPRHPHFWRLGFLLG